MQVPTSGSDGVLSLLQGGNISVGAADEDYLELLSPTQKFCLTMILAQEEKWEDVFTTPQIGSQGQCESTQ